MHDTRFSTSIFVLFKLDNRFLNSAFVLFKYNILYLSPTLVFCKRDVRVLMSIYIFLLKRDICFQFVIRFSLNIIRFKKQMTKSSRLNKTNVEFKSAGMFYRLQVAGCRLQVAGCRLQVKI